MKSTLIGLFCLLLPTSGVAGDFLDTFTYPDGTFPPEWTWTGDPRGGGQFLVQGEAFVHTEGGHVHYFRPTACDAGEYEFDIEGSYWGFGWRISPGNPNGGRCLCFYFNDYWGQWGYSFTEFECWTLSGYPERQYMWHNGSNLRIVHHWQDPESGWQHVRITDSGDRVQICVEEKLIFDEPFELIPDGYVGLGSATGSGIGFPAFDNVSFTETCTGVECQSWSSIKGLFR